MTMWLYVSISAAIVAIALAASQIHILSLVDYPAAASSQTEKMIAVSYTKYGSPHVLNIDKGFPRPVPNDDQVLVQVYATSVNPVDFKFRRNPTPGFIIPKPKIPGGDVAGVVTEVGAKVTKFQKGDRVAAMIPLIGSQWGSSAEYVAVKESYLCIIPDSISYVKAAAMPLVGLTVVNAFGKLTEPTKGKKIFIQAGAGGVGMVAIQYAKNVLNMEVTATASKSKAELLQQIGADRVIDYHTQNFTDFVKEYDVVLDPMSWKYEGQTLNQGNHVLKKSGHYLNILSSGLVNGKEKTLGILSLYNLMKHKVMNYASPGVVPKYDLAIVRPDGESLQQIFNLMEQGKLLSAIDDQVFNIYELSDAHAYLEQGYARGKVVVKIMP